MEPVNEILGNYAVEFTLATAADIVHHQHLDLMRLDYSLTGLKAVDDYLSHLHQNRSDMGGPEWVRTILRAGAYVGEVIRHNSPRPYDWFGFDDFIQAHPQSTSILGDKKDIAVYAVLSPGGGAFTLPLNKVLKFIVNGSEDSVAFYATSECRRAALSSLQPGS
jgi:hypothetical protein